MSKVALYVRVSTDDQTIENQIARLREIGARQGWQIADVFKDEGISGSHGRDKRPGYDALCKAIEAGGVDMVATVAVDRLGRSLVDLLHFMTLLQAHDTDLYVDQQGVDTSTPAGKAMFQMIGVFAEFERELIRKRTRDGLARAKAAGVRLGTPVRVPDWQVERVRELRATGKPCREISRETGLGLGTVGRICKSA